MLLMSEPCDDLIFIFQLFPEMCHLLHQLLHLLGSAVIFAGIQTLWRNLTIIHLQHTLEFEQLGLDRRAVFSQVLESEFI